MMISISSSKRKSKGFTLLELMVVLTVVGILAAIAYPSYLSQARKSKRVVAKSALLDLANREEQYYFVTRGYGTISQIYNLAGGTTTIYLDKNGTVSTTSNANSIYSVTVPAASSAAFTLNATALNDQANDACTAFSFTSAGVRSATQPDCW